MSDEKRGKGIPFAKGSETSADAADSMEKPSLRLRSKVRLYLYSCGPRGATDEEVQLALDMPPNTQRPRRLELEKLGTIRKLYIDGKQVKRTTKSGRKAGVYVHSLFETEEPVTQQTKKIKVHPFNPLGGTLPEREVSMGRQVLIEKLDKLKFQISNLSDELRSGEPFYDSTTAITEEMKIIISKFKDVVDAGRIFWNEVAHSDQTIQ